LPALEGLGLKPETLKDKVVLLCFWDYAQKPARHAVAQLAARAADLEKQGITVVLVRTSGDDRAAAQAWLEKQKVTFAYGEIPAKAADAKEKTAEAESPLFSWGVRGLPWLILADRSAVVRAEGLSATADLAALLNPASGK
jgi:hypothetical protein